MDNLEKIFQIVEGENHNIAESILRKRNRSKNFIVTDESILEYLGNMTTSNDRERLFITKGFNEGIDEFRNEIEKQEEKSRENRPLIKLTVLDIIKIMQAKDDFAYDDEEAELKARGITWKWINRKVIITDVKA